jgi:hypothetical protein
MQKGTNEQLEIKFDEPSRFICFLDRNLFAKISCHN